MNRRFALYVCPRATYDQVSPFKRSTCFLRFRSFTVFNAIKRFFKWQFRRITSDRKYKLRSSAISRQRIIPRRVQLVNCIVKKSLLPYIFTLECHRLISAVTFTTYYRYSSSLFSITMLAMNNCDVIIYVMDILNNVLIMLIIAIETIEST